ncbi:MAG TPA: LamG-like jellyroll fold domain-containing protein [Verrucomicrobiae bacterium]|nr:LamG-like jellyroll fold domain-containing protein [Verrucomicrobiae bacterium]
MVILLSLFPGLLRGQEPPPLDGGWSFPTNLNSWSFADTNTWESDLGDTPLSFTNLESTLLGNVFGSYSLWLDSSNPAWLRYRVQEGDGTTNLTVAVGTVSLWFAPNWASATTNQNGSGPGEWGRLIEVGAYTTNASYGWWSLYLDSGGTNLYFGAQTNSGDGAMTAYLSAPIDWATNEWHNLTLTYSATNTALYLDGELAASGAGVTVFPGPEVLTNGFGIGSDPDGLAQAHGVFDDLYTYDFPLDAGTAAATYNYLRPNYAINIFNVMAAIGSAPTVPPGPTVFNAISGPGYLQWAGNAPSCVTSSDVWLTNVTASLSGSGTNQTTTTTFEIAGGGDGLVYDVFATAALGPSDPAYGWAWLGQGYHCNVYTMTNLPPFSACLILGTGRDSDFDGLSDAYEKLVSQTDPYNADSDGDGLSDYYEVIAGLSPLTANSVPSLSAIAIPCCPVP